MNKLTDYQAGQLLHIHFTGDFKYKSNTGTRVAAGQWQRMINALLDGGYIEYTKSLKITSKGHEFLDANHLTIKTLN